MANFTINDLMGVLEKSGAKFGDSAAMQSAMPFLKESVGNTVRSQDPRMGQASQAYRQQLAQIAAMDQKLGSVYGNPQSNLFIEHPLQREKIISRASETGYDQADEIQKESKIVEKEQESTTKDAVDLYKQLEREQYRTEREIEKEKKKVESSNKKVSSEAKKVIKKKEDDVKRLQAERKKLGLDVTDKARIYKPDAVNVFLNSPTKFQKEFQRKVQSTPAVFPEAGFSKEDIMKELKEWESVNKTSKSSKKDSLKDLIKQASQ